MGGNSRHPYSHDPYQRQGNNNIMLRPRGIEKGGYEDYTWFYENDWEYYGYYVKSKHFRNEDTYPPTDPIAYPGLYTLYSMTIQPFEGSIRISTNCPTVKTRSDAFDIRCGYYDKDMLEIPELSGTVSVDHSVSYSNASVTGTSTITEVFSFNRNVPVRGYYQEQYAFESPYYPYTEWYRSYGNMRCPLIHINTKKQAAPYGQIAVIDIPVA